MEKQNFQHTEIVKFNGNQMVCPVIDGEPYVLAKSIIDGIGLNYDYALHSLKNNERLNTYLCEYKVMSDKFDNITLSNLGLNFGYTYTAIPVRKVAAWLYSFQANRVNEPARTILLKFQDRCDDVLFQFFFGRKELENKYMTDKTELLKQLRDVKTKLKNLRTIIANTNEGAELEATEKECREIKARLEVLEQKTFGSIFTPGLFDQLPEYAES